MPSAETSAFPAFRAPVGMGAEGARLDSMAVFKGALYVTLGANLASGLAARILAVPLSGGDWREVHVQPAPDRDSVDDRLFRLEDVPARLAQEAHLGHDGAFTGLTVYQGSDDAAPCLYVTTASIWGGRILRSSDGLTFVSVAEQDPRKGCAYSLHSPTVWGDRLVLTASGALTLTGKPTGTLAMGAVLALRKPSSKKKIDAIWDVLSEPGFSDPDNHSISAMAADGDRLLVATHNPQRGFQLWAGTGNDPTIWSLVLANGGHRFAVNPAATAISVQGANIYLATGKIATPGMPLDFLKSEAGEVIRVEPDGYWEIIVGEPRFTPDGTKIPVALLGPGFEDRSAPIIGAMGGQDRLYVATAAAPDAPNADVLAPDGTLRSTTDGEEWQTLDCETLLQVASSWIGSVVVEGSDVFVASGTRLLYRRETA